MSYSGIDFIGDIHGHAYELTALLKKLGYRKKSSVWSHPGRIAFFMGDFIDRGPAIPETLRVVRSMVEDGGAKTVMGNHEYNAICFNSKKPGGGYYREHSIKNMNQHSETIRQFSGKADEYDSHIRWFRTLPVFYESDDFRVVHAAWDHEKVQKLKEVLTDAVLGEHHIAQSAEKDGTLYAPVDTVLKGREMDLPGDALFRDKDGNERKAIRVKWWEDPHHHTYTSISVGEIDDLPDIPVRHTEALNGSVYGREELPVFFGHYWLRGNPNLYRDNICCLDYSVAKGGNLVAYRFDGEQKLRNEKMVRV